MSAFGLAGVIVAATLVAWVLFLVVLRARRPAGGAGSGAAGVTRRQFLNRAWLGAVLVGFSSFALASLDYLWPRAVEGAGGKSVIGDAERLRSQLQQTRQPLAFSGGDIPAPGFFLMTYEGEPRVADGIPAYVASNVSSTGFVALYRKCVHLGCTVPFCATSEWLECPCRGSKYSINGEYRSGPAPRGLDRFAVNIEGGKLVVDTSNVITGPPRGTVTSQPQAEGPHCVTISGA